MPFNIGPGEVIILLIIALLVLGPGKLPDVGAALGKSIREFRKAASDVQEATTFDPVAQSSSAGAPAATGGSTTGGSTTATQASTTATAAETAPVGAAPVQAPAATPSSTAPASETPTDPQA